MRYSAELYAALSLFRGGLKALVGGEDNPVVEPLESRRDERSIPDPLRAEPLSNRGRGPCRPVRLAGGVSGEVDALAIPADPSWVEKAG
jgi:hypothetical protein